MRRPRRSAGSVAHRRIVDADVRALLAAASGTARPRSSGAACRCRLVGQPPHRDRPARHRSRAADARRRLRPVRDARVAATRRRPAAASADRCAAPELRAGTRRRAPACRRRRRAPGAEVGLRADRASRSSGRAPLPSRRRPTCSQSAAISLMNVTDVARNALIACLVISADSTDIHSMRSVNGAKQRGRAVRDRSAVRTPTTTRSGCVNTSIALPSRRFSGEQANDTRRPPATSRPRPLEPRRCVPTGSCDETARARRRRGAGTQRSTCARRRSPRPRDRRRRPACRR